MAQPEDALSDDAFLSRMRCTRAEFAVMKPWRQRQLRELAELDGASPACTPSANEGEEGPMAKLVSSESLMELVMEHATSGRPRPRFDDEKVQKKFGVSVVCLKCKSKPPLAPSDFCGNAQFYSSAPCQGTKCKQCKFKLASMSPSYVYCSQECKQRFRAATEAAEMSKASVPAAVCRLWKRAWENAEMARFGKRERERGLEWLKTKGTAGEPSSESARDLLRQAVTAGHLELVRALLRLGVAQEPSASSGQVPLGLAISRGDPAMAKVLLDAGADRHAFQHGKPLIKFAFSELLRAFLEGNEERMWTLAVKSHPNRPAARCVQRLLLAGAEPCVAAFAEAQRLGETEVLQILYHGTKREGVRAAGRAAADAVAEREARAAAEAVAAAARSAQAEREREAAMLREAPVRAASIRAEVEALAAGAPLARKVHESERDIFRRRAPALFASGVLLAMAGGYDERMRGYFTSESHYAVYDLASGLVTMVVAHDDNGSRSAFCRTPTAPEHVPARFPGCDPGGRGELSWEGWQYVTAAGKLVCPHMIG
jgi:hypothetical protein